MSVTAAILLLLAAANVEIELAPDQPLPYVYVDDPLIIDLRSTEDVEATVRLTISAPHLEEAIETVIGPYLLRADGSRWTAIEDLPAARGYYTVRIQARTADATTERVARFCRIDRLTDVHPIPFYAHGPGLGGNALYGLRAAGMQLVRLDASRPDIDERMREMIEAGLRVVMHLDTARMEDAADQAATLANAYCKHIVRWELDYGGGPALLARIAEALRGSACATPVAVIVSDAEAFEKLISDEAGPHVRETVVLSDSAAVNPDDFYRIAERAGYESWRVHALVRGGPREGVATGAELAKALLRNLAAGVVTTGLDASLAYDGEVGASLAYLSGLAHRLAGHEHVGALELGEGVTALVFRDTAAWTLALWSEGSGRPVRIELGDPRDVALTDALNNPMPCSLRGDNSIGLSASREPVYLTGAGGTLPGQAARSKARQLADAFHANPLFTRFLGNDTMAAVRRVAVDTGGINSREDFFELIRKLPALERQWHLGELPTAVASPAIAQLARIARLLCSVEQTRGIPFLEPMQDTLARCEEFQSLYLTGSVGAAESHARGDWLLEEVRRLMDRGEALARAGVKIEAGAVAALAEWRARGLECTTLEAVIERPIDEADLLAKVEEETELDPDKIVETGEDGPVASEEGAPVVEESPAAPVARPVTHTVARGDNLSKIAREHGVELADLLKWNGLTLNSILQVGDTLAVSPPAGT